jgi:glycine/D-amino acid oxidase-like deaminating enzyme
MTATEMKLTPYWWDDQKFDFPTIDLPNSTDVLVVGSGYSGLHAAIELRNAGVDCHVIDAQKLGWGCSTRNGGQISHQLKPSFAELTNKHGADLARLLWREGVAATDWLGSFVKDHNLACDYQKCGLFVGAHRPNQMKKLAAEIKDSNKSGLRIPARLVTKDELSKELGTDSYHGGIVYPDNATLHPVKYHDGLLELLRSAGGSASDDCRALKISGRKGRFVVQTTTDEIRCERIIVATNGYTDGLVPWQQRRVIPIGSYVIATDKISPALMDELFPTNRNICDTRQVVYYYRPSPDRRRIIFGGRVSHGETDLKRSAPTLQQEMARLFPALAGVGISHSWMGFVGFTFDGLHHCGEQDGINFAAGYCGSGIASASYTGMRLAQSIANPGSASSSFSVPKFEKRPFYSGNPWFLAPTILGYKLADRFF